MARYVYLCPKCAKEKHKFKIVHFPHGGGIKEVFIDGKKAKFVLLTPSQKNVPIVEGGSNMVIESSDKNEQSWR